MSVLVPCKYPYIFTCHQTFVHGTILNEIKSSTNLNIPNPILRNSGNLNNILTQVLILKQVVHIVHRVTTGF